MVVDGSGKEPTPNKVQRLMEHFLVFGDWQCVKVDTIAAQEDHG